MHEYIYIVFDKIKIIKMKCIHFMGIYLFLLAIPFSSQLSNIRSIQNLIKNFDNNIDINFLFYSYHQQQNQNPYKCSAEYGPYCKFINNKSLLGIIIFFNGNVIKSF